MQTTTRREEAPVRQLHPIKKNINPDDILTQASKQLLFSPASQDAFYELLVGFKDKRESIYIMLDELFNVWLSSGASEKTPPEFRQQYFFFYSRLQRALRNLNFI